MELKTNKIIFGLSISCPINQKDENCPIKRLKQMRLLSLEEKKQAINNMNFSYVEKIHKVHLLHLASCCKKLKHQTKLNIGQKIGFHNLANNPLLSLDFKNSQAFKIKYLQNLPTNLD